MNVRGGAYYWAIAKGTGVDGGLMFAWFPKLLVVALSVALVLRLIVSGRVVAWSFSVLLPITYDAAEALWGAETTLSQNAHWLVDVLSVCAFGLFATIPGAFIGATIGGWLRRRLRVR